MKSEWTKYCLGNLYEAHNGLSKGGKYFGSGYPFLTFSTVFKNWFIPDELTDLVQSTEKEQEAYSIRRGDIFVTRTSETIDELGMSSVALKDYPNATYNGFTKRLRPTTDKVLPEFIGYYLRCPFFRSKFKSFSNMTTRASLKNEDLLSMEILLPPYEEQKKIANFLSSFDAVIRKNEIASKNLQQQAAALFKYWFVSFEKFDGQMPSKWNLSTLGMIADVSSGKRPNERSAVKTKNFTIPLVGAASIMGYTCNYLYDEKILITGRVGTHGIIQRFNSPCWASDNTLVIKSEYYEYVYQILQSIDYKKLNRGSTQPLITQTDIKNVEILLPPTEILKEFESLVGQIMKQSDYNIIENAKLTELRDTLLPKLISGELDVSEVNI